MARLALVCLTLALIAQASSTFIGFSHGSEPSQPDSAHTWSQESHIQVEHEGKLKKKWSWLPSLHWPWKKNKHEEQTHEHHEIGNGHYPVWKVHKYKGIEVQPITVIDQEHHNHNYHPEVSHQSHHHDSHETEKEVLSPFIGEGHTMDTLHKFWPALQKDKKFMDKFQQFQAMKLSDWGHTEPNHDWPKHVEDLHAHGSEHRPEAAIAALPEAPEVNLPGLHHLPMPELPYLDEKPVFDSYGKLLSHGETPEQDEDHVPENHPRVIMHKQSDSSRL